MPIAVSAAPVFFSLVSGYLRTFFFFFFGEALETENFFSYPDQHPMGGGPGRQK
jgi:hypothetical protein